MGCLRIADLGLLPVIADAARALRDEAILHPAAGTNLVAGLEPLSIFAEDVDGVLHIRCGHQAPHRLQKQLARLLGLELDRVRVIVPDGILPRRHPRPRHVRPGPARW